jgi:hypothetical protein
VRGLVPNFHINVPVSDLYIPKISPPALLLQIGGQTWKYINRAQIQECGNWETEH